MNLRFSETNMTGQVTVPSTGLNLSHTGPEPIVEPCLDMFYLVFRVICLHDTEPFLFLNEDEGRIPLKRVIELNITTGIFL